MRRTLHVAALAAGLFGSASLSVAQAPMPGGTAPISEADKQFLVKDAQGGVYEMAIATLAQQRSSREDIKAYAARILQDHANEGAEMQQLAMSKRVMLPAEMTDHDRVKLNGMDAETGGTLDHSFILEAVRINEEDKKDTQAEIAATADPDIKAFLQRYALVDAQHEEMAKALQKQ